MKLQIAALAAAVLTAAPSQAAVYLAAEAPSQAPSQAPVTGAPSGAPRPPRNDLCNRARRIRPGRAIASSTIGATPESDVFYIEGGGFGDGPGVWFKFTGTGNVLHFYLSCEESWDPLIQVWSGDSCTSPQSFIDGQSHSCNYDFIPVESELGTRYWILVNSFSPDISGDFEISMVEDDNSDIHCDRYQLAGASCRGTDICRDFLRTCKNPDGTIFPHYGSCQCEDGTIRCIGSDCPEYQAPANDDCVDAETLTIDEWAFGTTLGASVSPNMFGWGNETLGPAVWYTFIGTGDTLKLTLACDGLHNAGARVVSGTCFDYGGDYYGRGQMCEEGASINNIETRPNQTYIILIEGGDYTCVGTDCGPIRAPTGDFELILSRA